MYKRLLFPFVAAMALICAMTPSVHANPNPAAAKSPPLKVTSRCDVAALAPDVAVTVTVLVAIDTPAIQTADKRPPVAVSLVIDRSGSMEDAKKLDYAKKAGKTLIKSLGPDDQFALTIYNDRVQALYPMAKVTDKEKLFRLIDSITADATTFLSGGLEEGINQLKGMGKEGPCRVILLSDGLANRGVTQAEQVAAIGANAKNKGITVTTVGLGLDFNEDLMQLLAQRSGGQYYYVKDSEDLPAMFTQELNLTAALFTRNLKAVFIPHGKVSDVKVYGYSNAVKDQATDIEMSDLSSGEQRQILLSMQVKPEAAAGEQKLGALRLSYVDPAEGDTRTVDLPVELKIIADENARKEETAKQRDAIQQVRDEAILLEAEQAHVTAINELEKGNVTAARKILLEQKSVLAQAAPSNKTVASKMEAIDQDEQNLEQAGRDRSMLQKMSKASKSSAYQSAQGKSQGLMLQKGDKGFMVEKLQNALKEKGFYAKDVDGVYSQNVEDAVKAFQRAKSINADGIAGPATQDALGIR
ncbi:MAG: VWA domain-containing protein [Desulfobulbus sp.]|nr:VWA domain-containing protein [Desulfobulbus sp.]